MRALVFSLALLSAVGLATSATAQRPDNLRPAENVWKPAVAPKGGVSWVLLESTKEIQRREAGTIYSKPAFSSQVKALKGKRIKVAGYVMPLQSSSRHTHFVLLAYPPDCPFHVNPAPNQFIEVKTTAPVQVHSGVQSFEGLLVLGGQDESGIFYTLSQSREI